MFSVDHFQLLPAFGWLAALMFAAIWPSLPEAIGRRHAGWLIAFCAVQLLAAVRIVGAGPDVEWRQLLAVVSGSLLWEFARRGWNERSARRLSATTHLVALEALALVAAVFASNGGARPEWFLPFELGYTLLPGLLGAGAAWLLWLRLSAEPHGPRRRALRAAIVILGAFGLAGADSSPLGEILVPWLAAFALGVACLQLPEARRPAGLGCLGGLAVVAWLGPIVAQTSGQGTGAEFTDLVGRVTRASASLQGKVAAQLGANPIAPEVHELLRTHLETLRTSDPLVHAAAIWQSAEAPGRLRRIEPAAGSMLETSVLPGGPGFATRANPFVIQAQPAEGQPFFTAWAPLAPGRLETPTAWLSLEFPAIFWDVQHQHARRTRLALAGLLAAFCAMGFVLVTRHGIESTQRVALERVTAANRAKTEFLAFLSHEMRTPLQTILGRAELTRRESPEAARHADAIAAQGRHLLRLVNDLLDLGAIEAGRLQLRPAPFTLRTLLAALEEIHGPAAARKGLALDLTVAPEVPDRLIGDDARLRQILGNLLSNAVKYTSHGQVTLHVTRDSSPPVFQPSSFNFQPGERLAFAVTDTGPGLPPEKIPQLFTLFTRLDSGETFTREGTGVGLALVRRLCDLMDGTVTATNRSAGGAEFTVRLPFSVTASPPSTPPSAPESPETKYQPMVGDALTADSVSVSSALVTGSLRVLVAEDNTAAREFLVEAVATLGHTVESVADGDAALAACVARTFDVVLLDINLPGRDGIALARLLATRTPRPRLVACSAEAFAATREAALAAGMDAFLEKPVMLAALATALAPASPAPASGSLFERLRSPELSANARATLAREFPAALELLLAAHRAGDTSVLQRRAHHLRSTALLARDDALAELCRRLELTAAAGDDPGATVILAALTEHATARAP